MADIEKPAEKKEVVQSKQEVWRPVEEFSDYEVSNLGRVRSKDREKVVNGRLYRRKGIILRPASHISQHFRPYVNLSKDGKNNHIRFVATLVAEAFLGPPPSKESIVCYLNGDVADPRLENIKWGVRGETALINGTTVEVAALIPTEMIERARGLKRGGYTTREIQAELGLKSRNVVQNITKGVRPTGPRGTARKVCEAFDKQIAENSWKGIVKLAEELGIDYSGVSRILTKYRRFMYENRKIDIKDRKKFRRNTGFSKIIALAVPISMLEEIERHRYEGGFSTRNGAMIDLLKKGLNTVSE